MRPWSRTITVAVNRGFLAPGETITVRIGDRRLGSPGLRMQTYCEEAFHFLVLADVFATANWALLDAQPTVRVVPGAAASHVAVLPTQRRPGQDFALSLRADDVWGNPTDRIGGTFRLRASAPVAGLPESFTWPEGARAHRIEGLTAQAGDLAIDWLETPARCSRDQPIASRNACCPSGRPARQSANGAPARAPAAPSARPRLHLRMSTGQRLPVSDAFWADLNRTTAD